jgi:hypothetical protein
MKLDNLSSRQEVFDKALTHLRAQGKPSLNPKTIWKCQYRSPEGLKCAVGCLIPDEDYREEMEGRNANEVLREVLGMRLSAEESSFINDLQCTLHDNFASRFVGPAFLEGLEAAAATFAYTYHLTYQPPAEEPKS